MEIVEDGARARIGRRIAATERLGGKLIKVAPCTRPNRVQKMGFYRREIVLIAG